MNRLNDSSSLYLRQHKDNPVDWQPWDDAALTQACESGKPILLSIGYSACHWCHVMAHESFEDPETAALMNELYVNIKLDREERPDLDKLYQLSHQLLSSRGGGWPLTVFLDPDDLTPFFAGTYFPPEPRHGLPAFKELLQKIRQWFDDNRDSVSEQNQRLKDAIGSMQKSRGHDRQPDAQVFTTAFEQLESRYDREHGGFGDAPKFPQAPLLNLLQALGQMKEAFSDNSKDMLHETLSKMALSGLRDHLDGGFFRYSVDGSWTIPHFEKMLYDNVLLLPLYAETAAANGDRLMAETAEGVASWLVNEMRDDNGGFYASMDADAGGVEGAFHVWGRGELQTLLDASEYEAVTRQFGIDGPPNFEGQYWHLISNGPKLEGMESAIQKMREARALRTAPGTDTKQLTSWNALCMEGFARAGKAMQKEEWLDVAEQILNFLKRHCWKDNQLMAVYAQDQARFPAYLDDHAMLLSAVLELLQARWNQDHLDFAIALAETIMEKFEDSGSGGFFFSAADQATPVARLRPLQDDATPGGNGVAARALESLGHLTGEQRFLEAAGRTLSGSYEEQVQHPLAHATLLLALNDHLQPPMQVLITGSDEEEMQEWKAVIAGHHRVNCYLLGPGSGELPAIPGLHEPVDQTHAYICEGLRCLPPAGNKREFQKLLNSMDQ